MSEPWKRSRLGDVCRVIPGYAFKSSDWQAEGIPVVKIKNITTDNAVDLTETDCVPESVLTPKLQKFVLSDGDILLAMTGATAGKVGKVRTKRPILLNQRVAKIAPVEADHGFIWSVVSSPEYQEKFFYLADGAAQPNMSGGQIEGLEIPCPPLPVQRRIAGILSAYDELMENSQRRIRLLEAMARALYREWFVHFRFPGHEKHPRVTSPLGDIPQGWEVRKLGDLLAVDKGVSYNGAGLTEDGNPMVNLKNIQPGGGFRRDATKPYSGDFKPRHTVQPGDVILANTDLTQAGHVVASPALIPRLGDGKPILISHHLFAVRPAQGISSQFFYHLMLTEDFRGFAKGFAIGTTVLGLPKEGILNYTFASPPLPLIRDFVARASSIHGLVETLNQRIENLRRTRDLLLPRLLSGQVEPKTQAA